MLYSVLLIWILSPTDFRLDEESEETLKWERFLLVQREKQTEFALNNALKYAPKFRKIFEAADVPKDLIWLCLIESSFQHHSQSPTGAAGMFQFKKETARILGLKVNKNLDERLKPDLAAEAAARYLAYLGNKFDSWELVLAAYNWGEGVLFRTMRAHQVSTWEAVYPFVREETQNYVGKVKAAAKVGHAFFERMGVALDPVTLEPIASDDDLNASDVPPPPLRLHQVISGDTLYSLARHYRVSLEKLREINGLKGSLLQVGQELVIPEE